MANSATNLDLLSSSQANKEISANSLFDAGSPAMTFGRRASTTAGLTFGYYGGNVLISGVPTNIPNGTVTLAASATNYVEANPADGSVSVNQTAFTSGRTPLYSVVTGASTVTSYTDMRVSAAGVGLPTGGTVTSVALTTGGVVFNVSGSPITGAGTIALSLASQAVNKVFAGPASGGSAVPTFRSLVPADLPVMVGSGASHAAGIVPDPGSTAGTTRFLREDGAWGVPPGSASGTVTSVDLSVPGLLYTVSGGPVTGAGTLTFSLKTQPKNTVLAGPTSGSDAAPTMRALVAADLPAQPFDLTAFYPGVPGAGAIVTRVPVARAVSFPSGLTGSVAKASVAATSTANFDVQKNGSSVGTISFAASATSATFTAASAISLAAGDILSIIAPGTADATLANIGIVLAGTR